MPPLGRSDSFAADLAITICSDRGSATALCPSGWRGSKTRYPDELREASRRRRKWIGPDGMTGTDPCPVTSAWQRNIRAPAGFRQTDIGNAHSGCNLRDRSCPHQLVQILSFQIVSAASRREVFQGRQIRLNTFRTDTLTMRLGKLDCTVAVRPLARVVNFVRNALSRGAQGSDPKFGKIALVDTLDRTGGPASPQSGRGSDLD
jgi:hypothetical protein